MDGVVVTRTDEELQQDVQAELGWDARVRANEIGVTVQDGVVTLTGRVDHLLGKWAAEEAAHRVRGVAAVANDIEVELPSGAERSDAAIAAAAVQALDWDPAVPADNIEITVSRGWVTLKGEVDWQYQKQDAEQLVRRLAGVRGLTSVITVRPRTTPAELGQKIEQALVRNARTDAKQIQVEVRGNTAVLKGTVQSLAERQEAEACAWSAPGIISVDNQIRISA